MSMSFSCVTCSLWCVIFMCVAMLSIWYNFSLLKFWNMKIIHNFRCRCTMQMWCFFRVNCYTLIYTSPTRPQITVSPQWYLYFRLNQMISLSDFLTLYLMFCVTKLSLCVSGSPPTFWFSCLFPHLPASKLYHPTYPCHPRFPSFPLPTLVPPSPLSSAPIPA